MQKLKTKIGSVYEEDGQVQENVGAIIFLVMGVGIATLMLIFVGVLGGQVYSQTADELLDINATDPVAYNYVIESIQSGFKGLHITGSYLPIVVLAVIIFIVLGLVMSMGHPQNYGGGGSAL